MHYNFNKNSDLGHRYSVHGKAAICNTLCFLDAGHYSLPYKRDQDFFF